MRLRRLVERGELRATKNADGVYTFQVADLDALQARLAPEVHGAFPSIGLSAAKRVEVDTADAKLADEVDVRETGMPDDEDAGDIATDADPTLPPWLAAAAFRAERSAASSADDGGEERDSAGREDGERAGHEPPFWMVDAGAPWPADHVPVIEPSTRRVMYIASHQQHAIASQRAAEQAAVQVAAAAVAADAWRVAWRSTRVRMIADAVAVEAVMTGAPQQLAQTIWFAVGAAVDGLLDEPLADDGYAIPTARSVAQQVAVWWTWAAAWEAEAERASSVNGVDHGHGRRRARSRWRRRIS